MGSAAADGQKVQRDQLATVPGLVAGQYANASVTVDVAGRVTAIAAGLAGGLAPGFISNGVVANRYFGPIYNCANFGNFVPGIGALWAVPILIPRATTIDRLAARVEVAGAGGSLRLGIYGVTSVADPRPGALLLDSGVLSFAAVGKVEAAVSLALTGGQLYWMAVLADHATGAIGGMTASGAFPVFSTDLSDTPANTVVWGCNAAQAFGSLPNPFPAPTLTTIVAKNVAPIICVRVA